MQCYCVRRSLHSFPTRRSSDLFFVRIAAKFFLVRKDRVEVWKSPGKILERGAKLAVELFHGGKSRAHFRSEEHTSELQSHSDLVCRLLLEKKKPYNDQRHHAKR